MQPITVHVIVHSIDALNKTVEKVSELAKKYPDVVVNVRVEE